MKRLENNPKLITDNQLENLHANMELLGDLSGILHDEETDNIYGGNQRSKKWNLEDVEIEIVESFEVPTRTGTIALGYIIDPSTKEKFNYRKVRWTKEQRERALITANELGGATDWQQVKVNFEIPIVEEWGVEVPDWVTFEANENLPSIEPKKIDPDWSDEYLGSDFEKLAGFRTAISRKESSVPVRFLRDNGYLSGDVLDYGSGRDVHNYFRFDPAYNPDYKVLSRKYETVMCNYVINVLPLKHNRFELIRVLQTLIKNSGHIYLSIYISESKNEENNLSFQCSWSKKQWLSFVKSFVKNVEVIKAPFYLLKIN